MHRSQRFDWQRDDALEPWKLARRTCREFNKCEAEFHSHGAQFSHFSAPLKKNDRRDERSFLWGIRGGKFEAVQETDSESIAMETLYDLIGALPNNDADELRAAFRRAVKRVHPDINPEDPYAGLKFRRVVRANEILGDPEQRAAYDHLLALAHHEQEQAAKLAAADKVHELGSSVMALAGILVVAIGGYALFVQLSANAPTPATATADAAREPAAIIATGPAEEGMASASAAPQETSGRADIITSAIVPAAESAPGRVEPRLGPTPKQASKFASADTDRSIFLHRLRRFAHAFAELAQAKRLQRASHPIRSSPPQAGSANTIENNEGAGRQRRKKPVVAPTG